MLHKLALWLPGSTLLLLLACSPDRPIDTQDDVDMQADEARVTGLPAPDTATYHLNADRTVMLATQELQLRDTATIQGLRRLLHRRAHRLATIDTKHAVDTVGVYAGRRAANDEADQAARLLFKQPLAYEAYLQQRTVYYAGTPFTIATTPEGGSRGPAVVKREVENDGDVKIKYADGSKVKIDAGDGDRKVKNADGSKVKVDGDDGTRKVKK